MLQHSILKWFNAFKSISALLWLVVGGYGCGEFGWGWRCGWLGGLDGWAGCGSGLWMVLGVMDGSGIKGGRCG